MLQNAILLLILCYVSGQSHQAKKPFMLRLTPEQIMQTFDGVMSDDYIKVLAKDFAAKAAAHFMKEIRNQKNALVEKLNTKRTEKYRSPSRQYKEANDAEMVETDNEKTKSVKSQLNEQKALKLLQDPSPDGDHLESSGEFSDKEKKTIPVIQVTKINGVYYRRLLGMI